eukprot:TRINITY_DN228_c0_g1_i1.p1 TRINITY_DN228_c0_g1~~TRINITY_DN228_c0_g1_i1.p1  ORF type:complete len:201 (+),score=27.93 TRINITY_DN228_c0_g1_i1:148-750(+)
MNVFFIRHAESNNNLLIDGLSRADYEKMREPNPGITPKGKSQLSLLCDYLESKSIAFTKVYCSPLTRALESAKVIHERLKVPVEVRNDIFETGGLHKEQEAYKGNPRSWFAENYPTFGVNEDITEEGWYHLGRRETAEDTSQRARKIIKWISTMAKEQQDGTQNLIIITHAAFFDIVMGHVTGRATDSSIFSYFNDALRM